MAKILIVDDERGILNAMQRLLKRHGYSVEVAEDAEEAIGKLATFTPDLVLVDYRLQEANGLDLLEKVRHMAPSAVRVLMGATMPNDLSLLPPPPWGKEFEYFLPKPWTNETLLEHMQEWLKRLASSKP
jgi:two-component system response regulator VicR/two-component system response regulator RegX3